MTILKRPVVLIDESWILTLSLSCAWKFIVGANGRSRDVVEGVAPVELQAQVYDVECSRRGLLFGS